MKYLLIICVIIFSCTDDRSLDSDDFEVSPRFVANVFQTQYSAEQINAGNDSIPIPNTIHDFVDIDFLNEQYNADYLESLEFKFLAKNSINRPQTLDFIFFDVDDFETFRVTETIPSGNLSDPTIKTFSVELNSQQTDIITSSIRAEVFVNHTRAATNLGEMQIECSVEAVYLYLGE
jgi:hypothetical protein